ncbi:MAG: tetratricopeptide repeat protein [Bacteroidales bacterium]|nr:tetratricopeptide repeat protein [Bacteroidales bacterium]
MKYTSKTFVLTTIFLFSALAGLAQKNINQYEPTATFERGLMLFENKHYASALECFESYIAMNEGNNNIDIVTARYYEAVSSLFLDNSKGENKIIAFVKENPTSLMAEHANFLYANTLFSDRRYRDALKIYNTVNTRSLNDEEKYECKFKEAYCYYQTNNVDKAKPIFKELTLSDNTYRNDARYYYAHIMYINGDHDEALNYFNIIKEDEKYKDIANTYILQINFERNNYFEVSQNGDEILNKSKKKRKADVALMLAESWHQQGNYEKSLEYYNIVVENSNRRLPREVEFKIAFCMMKTNDFEGAIKHFAKVTDINDELGQYGSYYMAQCYTKTNQDKFARNTFFKAYDMNFNDTISENALLNYAILSFIPGIDPFNETVNILNDHIKNNPNSDIIDELQEIAVHILLNSNNYNAALECMEQYTELSPELKNIQSELTFSAGIQQYKEGKYAESLKFFKKSTEAEAMFWMADAHYQMKDENKAMQLFLQFIKNPTANKTEVYPLAYYNLGYLYLNKGDFKNSLTKFKDFINYDKSSDKVKHNDSWMRIGDCYFVQRQYNDAITAYSNAVKSDNRNADYAYYQQAMAYGTLGKTNEKISCLNIITSRYQKSTFYDKALYEIGMAYLSTNDNRSAIAAFDKIVKEKPRSTYARKSMMKTGMIYYNNDENDKALETLKNVVAKYPNTEESREALNIISNIYRDKNEIQSYFDYIEKNNLAVISIDKQDSLSFVTTQDFYSKRNYSETLKGVKQYLEKYPNGAYLLDIHYFAVKSMEGLNNMSEIRQHIEYIISQPNNDYTDYALLLIARMDYDSENYNSSAEYYERLANITENQDIMIEAIEGCMKSYYFNKEYDKSIEKANMILAVNDISTNQKLQANYILAKSYFDRKDYKEALNYFNICIGLDNSTIGAESGYYSALCLYNMQKYDEAEEKVFEISDKYNNHIYWNARSFITLSDVYVAKDNIFQAKETLKSVIDNYPDDEPNHKQIVSEAQDKLDIINATSNE